MKPHIQQTIDDLKASMAELQTMIDLLTRLVSSQGEAAPAPAPTSNSHTKSSRKIAGRKAVPNGMSGSIYNVICTMRPPFDQNSIHAAMKGSADLKQVSGAVAYLKKTGKLKVVEEGRPGYPTKFKLAGRTPASGAPAAETKPPIASREELERQLAAACKQRDHARANGRDTMVEIFQKDIDSLEAQLEAIA